MSVSVVVTTASVAVLRCALLLISEKRSLRNELTISFISLAYMCTLSVLRILTCSEKNKLCCEFSEYDGRKRRMEHLERYVSLNHLIGLLLLTYL